MQCYFCIECFVEITRGVNELNRAEWPTLELGSFRKLWARVRAPLELFFRLEALARLVEN